VAVSHHFRPLALNQTASATHSATDYSKLVEPLIPESASLVADFDFTASLAIRRRTKEVAIAQPAETIRTPVGVGKAHLPTSSTQRTRRTSDNSLRIVAKSER
jgi:hypothetical protein